MKKVLLLCPSSYTVKSFRIGLIKKFQEEGCQVGVCAFDEEYKEIIQKTGVDFFYVKMQNRSLNPFKFLTLKKYYKRLITEYQPDIVFTFVLKPNTIGVQAAYNAGVKDIYSMVEGAGEVFTNNTLKWKLIRWVVCNWYKSAFKKAQKVFFLNKEDKQEFISRKLVKEEQSQLIMGVGVDLQHFAYQPVTNHANFLMIARMLVSKGVYEYCECARRVKRIHPNAVFSYLGAEGNVKISDIQEYIDEGSIRYLGTKADVREDLKDSCCYILPSYREGLPMSIMEAEATGRAIITTDAVGCRDTVQEGYNGFLVATKNIEAIVQKCIWIIEHPKESVLMGKNARAFAENYFDSRKINDQIFQVVTE